MTRDEILKLEAGREIDALISKAIGEQPEILWAIADKDGTGFYDIRSRKVDAEIQLSNSPWLVKLEAQVLPIEKWKPYSTDIAAAWEVIEQIRKLDKHWSPGINWDDDDGDGNPMWVASFTYYGDDKNQFQQNEVWSKSAPLAICRAALLAVMERPT